MGIELEMLWNFLKAVTGSLSLDFGEPWITKVSFDDAWVLEARMCHGRIIERDSPMCSVSDLYFS